MNATWAGEVSVGKPVTPITLAPSVSQTFLLRLLAIEHDAHGSVTVDMMVTPKAGPKVRSLTLFGTGAHLRETLFGVLDAGEKLELVITAMHHDHPCKVAVLISYDVKRI